MTPSKAFALICCTAVASCVHQPAFTDVYPATIRVAIGALPDSHNRLLVKVRDGTTPKLPLGFASVTVTQVTADSTRTSAHWDAQSRADGLAAFILPDSGVYDIDVRLARRGSFRHRLRLTTGCRQSLDVYLEEAPPALAMPSLQNPALRSRGILTTCAGSA